MIGQDYYRLARADSAETIPGFFEEGITLHEMEKLKVTSHGEQMIAMLNYFYANSQLSRKERIILRDFIHKKLVWPHPFCTLLYSETIEEDKDNGVVLRVKRFIELNITTWSIRLLKTAECLRKVPRFTWAKFYAK
ncbi:unnamed protein product [Heligmosomoides polygyrus]|uniref:BTB domain-containing protein n=1 Tax=Heligmosomoides polygyrus TaxID=6339 RepID=A0A3P7YZ40_HELPZ|nr:unnamed protein product [Heligmosomoides polygyrus]